MDPLILFVELSHYRVNSAFVLIAVMLWNSDHTVALMDRRHTAHTTIYDDLSSSFIAKTSICFFFVFFIMKYYITAHYGNGKLSQDKAEMLPNSFCYRHLLYIHIQYIHAHMHIHTYIVYAQVVYCFLAIHKESPLKTKDMFLVYNCKSCK